MPCTQVNTGEEGVRLDAIDRHAAHRLPSPSSPQVLPYESLQWHNLYVHTTEFWRTAIDGVFHFVTGGLLFVGALSYRASVNTRGCRARAAGWLRAFC